MLDLEANPAGGVPDHPGPPPPAGGSRRSILISGDREGATQAVAAKLGIDHYFAEVLPHEKAEYVGRLQARGLKVCMVGDGINDSAALSRRIIPSR